MEEIQESRFSACIIPFHVLKDIVQLNGHKHDISKRFVLLIYL